MITPIRKMSDALFSSDATGKLDFIFIDEDHSEDAVRLEYLVGLAGSLASVQKVKEEA